MSDALLPPSTTALERAAAAALAEITRVDIPLRALWDPDTCPTALLPYLAWAFSVDRWDDTWPIATQRAVIRNSFALHQHKGTIAALRRMVEPLGYLIEITEWWQREPEGPPGTFAVAIGTLDQGITGELYIELERLLAAAKPVSRHLIGLDIRAETRGPIYVGAGTYTGEIVTVYPYLAESVQVRGPVYIGAAEHIIDTASVYPQ